jgi:hypothetical protein
MKKRLILTSLFLLVNIITLFAQPTEDPPCGGADPDATDCPIDNWVFPLAASFLLVTTLHLRNKQNNIIELTKK